MPLFQRSVIAESFKVYDLWDDALTRVHAFCESIGKQLTRDLFTDHKVLFELGCKFVCVFVFFVR